MLGSRHLRLFGNWSRWEKGVLLWVEDLVNQVRLEIGSRLEFEKSWKLERR